MRKKNKKKLQKVGAGLGIMALLVVTPASLTHAQSIVFTKDAGGNWKYSSGFQDTHLYSAFVTSDGRSSSGVMTDPKDTEIPATASMEVLVVDTNGAGFSDSCNTPHYTGNTTTDLSCYIAAAERQGFPYVIGQAVPVVVPAPCICP